MARFLAATVLGFLCVLATAERSTAATLKVGNGTPASCTEAAFLSAVLDAQAPGDDTIRFRCGSAPVTILILGPVTIPDQTTIDGESRITLQALHLDIGFPDDLLHVEAASTVVLKRLTLRLGWQVIYNQGDLTIRESA